MAFNEFIQKTIAGKLTLIPLQGVQFIQQVAWGDPQDLNYVIYNLEAESNLKLAPVERMSGRGFPVQVGWNLEANMYLPYNSDDSIEAVQIYLLGFLKTRYTVIFLLGNAKAWSEGEHEMPGYVNTTSELKIQVSSYNVRHSIEHETVEFRLRTIIRLKGYVPIGGVSFT